MLNLSFTPRESKLINYVCERQMESIMRLYTGQTRDSEFFTEFPFLSFLADNNNLLLLESLSDMYTEILYFKDNHDILFSMRPSMIEYFTNILGVWSANLKALDEDALSSIWYKVCLYETAKMN